MRDFKHKILTQDAAEVTVSSWKSNGVKTVFTNGVFDIIHPGHVLYLSQAKELGDKLVVGLNSDASTKTLAKGKNRPINHEQARAIVLAAIESVDIVVVFNKTTPELLIEQLSPDVLVKGGDYAIDEIAGSQFMIQNGREVRSLPFVEGYSTTAIEQKILGIN